MSIYHGYPWGSATSTGIVNVGTWSTGSTTSSTITIGTSPNYPMTTTVSTGISIGGSCSTTLGDLRFGPPTYTDLIEKLPPGTEWFPKGTILKLRSSMFMQDKSEECQTMYLASSFFVYMGVIEDFNTGKERHWFLTDSGKVVQYNYWVSDLGWRAQTKRLFDICEEAR